MFRDGDVLLTYGKGGFWPPRRWVLWVVYKAIRKYQKEKWRQFPHCWAGHKLDYRPTHVRVYLSGQWWEVTYPKAQWVTTESLQLQKKEWRLVRYHAADTLDVAAMIDRARQIVADGKYDVGDLLDTGISALLGNFKRHIRIFGDRVRKYFYCSTGAREVLTDGGAAFWMKTIDPAYFANNPREWHTISHSRR